MLAEASAANNSLPNKQIRELKYAPTVIALGWLAGGLTQLIPLLLLVESLHSAPRGCGAAQYWPHPFCMQRGAMPSWLPQLLKCWGVEESCLHVLLLQCGSGCWAMWPFDPSPPGWTRSSQSQPCSGLHAVSVFPLLWPDELTSSNSLACAPCPVPTTCSVPCCSHARGQVYRCSPTLLSQRLQRAPLT